MKHIITIIPALNARLVAKQGHQGVAIESLCCVHS